MPNEPRSASESSAVEAAIATLTDSGQGDVESLKAGGPDLTDSKNHPPSAKAEAAGAGVSALSEGQRGLWALQKMAPGMSAYNVPFCFRTLRRLDRDAFRKACCALLERNPILANPIHGEAGVPYRAGQPSEAPFFQEEDASTLSEKELLPHLARKLKEPFSLERGPMIRVHVLSRSADEQIVLIVIHHISFDAGSYLPFAAQLFDAYEEFVQRGTAAPAPQSTSHVAFIEWERKLLEGREARQHLDFWRQQLADAPPILNLPTDLARTGVVSFAGRTWEEDVPSGLADRIRSLCRLHGITPPTLFFSIYKILLARYAGEDDLVVGLTIDLRPQGGFEPFIGDFINMVP
ncbi:MAG TPA: condensation domain-containing protein, partial [Bradyrhizobium sp.]|nr:condensation domain-containing protein [Bradyrhizobium sp.]